MSKSKETYWQFVQSTLTKDELSCDDMLRDDLEYQEWLDEIESRDKEEK